MFMSGGAKVLGNLPVPGRLIVWQGSTALAVSAGGVV